MDVWSLKLKLEVGDIVRTKKNHPCGGFEFEILRKGADFKIKCTTCGKEIWITREKIQKRIKFINGEKVT